LLRAPTCIFDGLGFFLVGLAGVGWWGGGGEPGGTNTPSEYFF